MVEKNEEEAKRANALTPDTEDNPAIVDENVEGGSTPNVAVTLATGSGTTGKTPEEVKAEREEDNDGI